MKAILVIDFPKSCYACPLSQMRDGVIECYITKSNQSTCPLKHMPEKKEEGDYMEDYDSLVAIGWNACLEEIEK